MRRRIKCIICQEHYRSIWLFDQVDIEGKDLVGWESLLLKASELLEDCVNVDPPKTTKLVHCPWDVDAISSGR